MEIQIIDNTDLVLIHPESHQDFRGSLSEHFRKDLLEKKLGYSVSDFCQENEVHSKKGVLRGLHYQIPPHAQSKLISVVHGSIYDVVVDMRKWSENFGQVFGFFLSDDHDSILFIPRGFAHGFLTLSDQSLVFYKMDQYYHPSSEQSIAWDDSQLNIRWPMSIDSIIVSQRDRSNIDFSKAPSFDDPKAI